MRIDEVCAGEVVCCRRNASVLELAQVMRNSHVGAVVVADEPNGERVPVGIVTDRDLVVEVMAKEIDPAGVTAEDIMATELVTAAETEDVHDVVERMRLKGVRRIPVLNRQGGLAGIVALDDLLRVLGEELTLLGRVMSRERFQEQAQRR